MPSFSFLAFRGFYNNRSSRNMPASLSGRLGPKPSDFFMRISSKAQTTTLYKADAVNNL
ncbi:hypothetical protein ALO_16042 [Acetonema longum DSM 6540]|uniref:Uncharacterized protein n=1 Tax=Acetonema longum DSM 6540 TaxID=1009370 RepID=F7NM81_9FIRM|nr:hypothetical protein ALO_16042 [Acetonema longum DSM 6540]